MNAENEKEIIEFEGSPVTFEEWANWLRYHLGDIIARVEQLKSDLDYWAETDKKNNHGQT
ncbi:MAG: hypothetical protein DDT19_00094 [Syntrophomonadaceae bacterium]|nr:hypothetical protein [Bacillota bacterium]